MAETLYAAVVAEAERIGNFDLGGMLEIFAKLRPLHFPEGLGARGAVEAYRKILQNFSRNFSEALKTPSPQSPPESPRFGFRSPDSVARADDRKSEISEDEISDRDRLVADATRLRRISRSAISGWRRHVRRANSVALTVAKTERAAEAALAREILRGWLEIVEASHRRSVLAERLRVRSLQRGVLRPHWRPWRVFAAVHGKIKFSDHRKIFDVWRDQFEHRKLRNLLLERRVVAAWRRHVQLEKAVRAVSAARIAAMVQIRRGFNLMSEHSHKQHWVKARRSAETSALLRRGLGGFRTAVADRKFLETCRSEISRIRRRCTLRHWRHCLRDQQKIGNFRARAEKTEISRFFQGWSGVARNFRSNFEAGERRILLGRAKEALRRLQAPVTANRKFLLHAAVAERKYFGLWRNFAELRNEKRRNFRSSQAACLALLAVERMQQRSWGDRKFPPGKIPLTNFRLQVVLRAWKWQSAWAVADRKFQEISRLSLAFWSVRGRLEALVCDRKFREISASRRRASLVLSFRQWEYLFLSKILKRKKLVSLVQKKQDSSLRLPFQAWLDCSQLRREGDRKLQEFSDHMRVRRLARGLMALLQGMRVASRFVAAREISDLVFLGSRGLEIFRVWRTHADLERRAKILVALNSQRSLRKIFSKFLGNFRFTAAVHALLEDADARRATERSRKFLRAWKRYVEISRVARNFRTHRDWERSQAEMRRWLRTWKFLARALAREEEISEFVTAVRNFRLKKTSLASVITVTALQTVGRRLERVIGNFLRAEYFRKFLGFARLAAKAEQWALENFRQRQWRRAFESWRAKFFARRVARRENEDLKLAVLGVWRYLSAIDQLARYFRSDETHQKRQLEENFLVWLRRTRDRTEVRNFLASRVARALGGVWKFWTQTLAKERQRATLLEELLRTKIGNFKRENFRLWRAQATWEIRAKRRTLEAWGDVRKLSEIGRHFRSSTELSARRRFFKCWVQTQIDRLASRMRERRATQLFIRRLCLRLVNAWRARTAKEAEISRSHELVAANDRSRTVAEALRGWALSYEKWKFVRSVFDMISDKVTAADALKYWRATIKADDFRRHRLKTTFLLGWQRESLAQKVQRFLNSAADRHGKLRLLRKALLSFRKNALIKRLKPLLLTKGREAHALQGILALLGNSVARKKRRSLPRLSFLFRKWRNLLSIH